MDTTAITSTGRADTGHSNAKPSAKHGAAGRPRTRLGTRLRTRQRAALVVAGLAFAAYPMLRGYGTEAGLEGARLYARHAWLLAHLLGMVGFVAAGWGLAAVDLVAARWAMAGTALLLPYYGAEAYGLHALGRRALELGDGSSVAAADLFRYQPVAVTTFALGLAAVAVAGVRLLLVARGETGPGVRWPGRPGLVLTGLALLGYLPQFFAPAAGRIGHGLVLGAGLLLLASRASDAREGQES